MRETLLDIQSKLRDHVYTNEEHVRLSLVARILQELGWDIWDPKQVNTEFAPVPGEDRSKVDIAMFLKPSQPSVFIEIKAVGGITRDNLAGIERQLRDYNRNMASEFCIITDGRQWRFYYSLTPGEFRDKCFKTLDLLEDGIDDLENSLKMFLGKSSIDKSPSESESKAKHQAKELLALTLVEKAMERCLPEARRLALQNPLISLADALVQLVGKEGYSVSPEDAGKFIKKFVDGSIQDRGPGPAAGSGPGSGPGPGPGPGPAAGPGAGPGVIKLDPHRPEDLRFTRNVEGQVGETNVRKWKGLLHAAVEKAWRKEPSLSKLGNCGVGVVERNKTDEGFTPLRDLGISVRGVSANDAWKISLNIAEKLLNLRISVRFSWADKTQAAHPGREGILSWSPQQT